MCPTRRWKVRAFFYSVPRRRQVGLDIGPHTIGGRMKFNTGFFDGFFGKKTMVQVPQDDGTTKQVTVTEAWLKKMQAEGKISMSAIPSVVPFHIIGPDGSETRHLQVGVDIPEDQYKRLADPATGDLYGLTVYENGTQNTSVIPKQVWESAKAQFRDIDQEGEEFMRSTMDKFKGL